MKDPLYFFSEYKEAAWRIYRGEFPNGAERERELKDKCLDYATVMHYVDLIVGLDRDIDYWKIRKIATAEVYGS